MPLDKSCSIQAFKTNLKRLVEEGYENPQLFAIAMNTLKRACGVDPMARMSPEEVVSAKSEEAFGLAGPPKVFNPYRTGLASHLWPNLPEKGVFKSGWERDRREEQAAEVEVRSLHHHRELVRGSSVVAGHPRDVLLHRAGGPWGGNQPVSIACP
jgi:hypothetical protein